MADKPYTLMINPRPQLYLSMLDEVIICKIFDYLNLYELSQMAEIDINYQRIIGERIISKTTLDISSISRHFDVRRAFKLFGEFAKQLKVCESDIQYKDDEYTCVEELFRLIDKRCINQQLEEITLCLDRDAHLSSIDAIPELFDEIKTLTIEITPVKHRSSKLRRLIADNADDLLDKLLQKCQKLHSLTFSKCNTVKWKFLLIPQIKNLQSICFQKCQLAWEAWDTFIKAGVRPLKSLSFNFSEFDMEAASDESAFIRGIVEAFPHLEKFQNYCSGFINTSFDGLEQLRALKEICIDSHSSEVFEMLANINSLEKLSFLSLTERYMPCNGIKLLKNVRTVQFFADPGTLHFRTVKEFIQLPQLNEWIFTVSGCPIHENIISTMVFTSPTLRTLNLGSETKITAKFYSFLVAGRKNRFPKSPPLHIFARINNIKIPSNLLVTHNI